jgi:hypothetical protein
MSTEYIYRRPKDNGEPVHFVRLSDLGPVLVLWEADNEDDVRPFPGRAADRFDSLQVRAVLNRCTVDGLYVEDWLRRPSEESFPRRAMCYNS